MPTQVENAQELKSKITELSVSEDKEGLRLDRFLALSLPDHSRASLQKLIKLGNVSCSGKVISETKFPVKTGMEIKIEIPEVESFLAGEDIPLEIIYEDDDMLVINKTADMVVHPAAGNRNGTVVNALIGKDSDFAGKLADNERPGIVHRLDKDTSGCLIIAKNQQSLWKLSKSFHDRKVEKTYLALCCGIPQPESDTIISSIGRDPNQRKKMAVLKGGGKTAITRYRLLKTGTIDALPISLLEVKIETGRTHQIRVHLASRKVPVLGDSVYGGHQKISASRQMLHAWKIKIPHPRDERPLEFKSEIPEDFKSISEKMESL